MRRKKSGIFTTDTTRRGGQAAITETTEKEGRDGFLDFLKCSTAALGCFRI